MDRAYFERYCQRGPYAEIWRDHSGIENCLGSLRRMRLRPSSVLVLGTATGEVLAEFERICHVRPYGCELSPWAHARIPVRLRRRVRRADLRRYVPDLVRSEQRFELVFSNSLVYLEERDVAPVLRDCARIGDWFHFWSSTSDDYEAGDRYRTLLRSRAWWRKKFIRAGFAPTRSRYLWRALRD